MLWGVVETVLIHLVHLTCFFLWCCYLCISVFVVFQWCWSWRGGECRCHTPSLGKGLSGVLLSICFNGVVLPVSAASERLKGSRSHGSSCPLSHQPWLVKTALGWGFFISGGVYVSAHVMFLCAGLVDIYLTDKNASFATNRNHSEEIIKVRGNCLWSNCMLVFFSWLCWFKTKLLAL